MFLGNLIQPLTPQFLPQLQQSGLPQLQQCQLQLCPAERFWTKLLSLCFAKGPGGAGLDDLLQHQHRFRC
ncbi:hypothetical protein D3C81_2039690 [compost metagenome]